LYSLLLQRAASAGEIDGWVAAVTSAGREGVALAFLRSAEHRIDMVRAYYADLLHRIASPSAAEVTPWADSAGDLTAFRASFLKSAEFTLNG